MIRNIKRVKDTTSLRSRFWRAFASTDCRLPQARGATRIPLPKRPDRGRHPDEQAKAAIGRNVLDPVRRAPAARAGRDQAARALDAVRAVWE